MAGNSGVSNTPKKVESKTPSFNIIKKNLDKLHSSMYTLQPATNNDHPVLLQIWEASVKATHLFLQPGDIEFYKQTIIEHKAFEQVHITVIKNNAGKILGFTGMAGSFIEMLFIDPTLIGTGIGKLLLQYAINELGANRVDVNEQNENAVRFYQHFGFSVASRSPLDGTGKAYPILHLQLSK